MRIRIPFAVSFLVLCGIAAYLGLGEVDVPINDKVLHFITFFILTTTFYWILEATRRRVVGLTVSVCTLFLGIGSEFLQAFVTTRVFDLVDILANLLGSGLAVMLSTWYHRRMLERKLERKRMATMGAYTPVAGEEEEEGVVEFDQELGEIDTNEDAEAQTWK